MPSVPTLARRRGPGAQEARAPREREFLVPAAAAAPGHADGGLPRRDDAERPRRIVGSSQHARLEELSSRRRGLPQCRRIARYARGSRAPRALGGRRPSRRDVIPRARRSIVAQARIARPDRFRHASPRTPAPRRSTTDAGIASRIPARSMRARAPTRTSSRRQPSGPIRSRQDHPRLARARRRWRSVDRLPGRRGQLPALDTRQMFPHRVDVGNRQTAPQAARCVARSCPAATAPSAGAASIAEAPPDRRTTRRSPRSVSRAASRSARDAGLHTAAIGNRMGCRSPTSTSPSVTSAVGDATAAIRRRQRSTSARAIGRAALPAATTLQDAIGRRG